MPNVTMPVFAAIAILVALTSAITSSARAQDGRGALTAPSPARDGMSLRQSVESPGPTSLVDPLQFRPPYEPEDGLTIVTQAGRIRIGGLDGPARRAICFDREKRLWACGLQARAALANLVRGKPITCRRALPAPTEAPSATCSVAGQDIGHALVAAGFARPIGEPGAFGPALERARAEKRGLWNGGWSIRRDG